MNILFFHLPFLSFHRKGKKQSKSKNEHITTFITPSLLLCKEVPFQHLLQLRTQHPLIQRIIHSRAWSALLSRIQKESRRCPSTNPPVSWSFPPSDIQDTIQTCPGIASGKNKTLHAASNLLYIPNNSVSVAWIGYLASTFAYNLVHLVGRLWHHPHPVAMDSLQL